jgi:hypothetical protein
VCGLPDFANQGGAIAEFSKRGISGGVEIVEHANQLSAVEHNEFARMLVFQLGAIRFIRAKVFFERHRQPRSAPKAYTFILTHCPAHRKECRARVPLPDIQRRNSESRAEICGFGPR